MAESYRNISALSSALTLINGDYLTPDSFSVNNSFSPNLLCQLYLKKWEIIMIRDAADGIIGFYFSDIYMFGNFLYIFPNEFLSTQIIRYEIEHDQNVTHWDDYKPCEILAKVGTSYPDKPGMVMTTKKQIINP
jgi:hypothetical protein